jgi:hypothetical protein
MSPSIQLSSMTYRSEERSVKGGGDQRLDVCVIPCQRLAHKRDQIFRIHLGNGLASMMDGLVPEPAPEQPAGDEAPWNASLGI